MSKTRIFIDGSAGTTGLRIRERLAAREDLELLALPEERRKDPAARAEALDAADVAFLCLPDAAAVEAVSLVRSESTAIIDTSTAHRTAPGWAYGFPELAGARDRIRASRRIANPGCHASGFVALVAPLVRAGIVRPDARLCCFSLTGYTGGGKKMIAEYEAAEGRSPLLAAPRQYGLGQSHKHLPEMAAATGLESPPAFCPVVADFPCGMEVTVPLFARDLRGTRADVADALRAAYLRQRRAHPARLALRQPRQGRLRRRHPEPQPPARRRRAHRAGLLALQALRGGVPTPPRKSSADAASPRPPRVLYSHDRPLHEK